MTRIEKAVRRDWKASSLEKEIRSQKWFATEPNRIDRTAWIGSYDQIRDLAKAAVPSKEWKEAQDVGFEDEIVDEYMDALAEMMVEKMSEHVYATFLEGEAYLGQYEDMSAEELRAMGFEIGKNV
jgi:hypothetical protein